MAKVKCSVCANEEASFCKIKKVKISLNKKRLCEAYIYDESKLKKKQDIKITRIPFSEQEEFRKEAKKKRKELRALLKQQKINKTADEEFIKVSNERLNTKHPLTGDLSRFVSSSTKTVEKTEETKETDGN
jgi:hypothetical protein